jgi:hypothetical protein
MTDPHEPHDPWADVFLPAPVDPREIYEYATSVGAERRGQRRRRQLVLTICGGLVVALTAAGIGLSGGGGGGQSSIRVATQASIPRASARSTDTVPAPSHDGVASAPAQSAAPPAPPVTSLCRALAGVTIVYSAKLTAFHALPLPTLPVLDTTTTVPTPGTTTTTTSLPPPDTTTTTVPPNPGTTTPTTTRHTPPPTGITVSPDTFISSPPAFPGNAPTSPLLRPRTRC